MPQSISYKGLVFLFLLFFLSIIVTANDSDLDECINGERGNLEIDIREPEDSDNFEPGDIMDVEVEVRNNGQRTRDVVVEASLYNVDEDITVEQEDSDEESLSPGEEDNFDFELDINRNSRRLDNDDRFIVFVKAFEEGNEGEICEEEFVNVELELENEAVSIDSVRLLPSQVECGTVSTLVVEVSNIGEEELEDVKVRASNSRLNLAEVSPEFDLDELGEEDDEFIAKLDLDIPKNIDEGNYNIDVDVLFDSETETDTVSLDIFCDKKAMSNEKGNGGDLFIIRSNMPTKIFDDVDLIKTNETFTLLLVNIVLFLFLIFLIIILARD